MRTYVIRRRGARNEKSTACLRRFAATFVVGNIAKNEYCRVVVFFLSFFSFLVVFFFFVIVVVVVFVFIVLFFYVFLPNISRTHGGRARPLRRIVRERSVLYALEWRKCWMTRKIFMHSRVATTDDKFVSLWKFSPLPSFPSFCSPWFFSFSYMRVCHYNACKRNHHIHIHI